jgi:hypothetical protein
MTANHALTVLSLGTKFTRVWLWQTERNLCPHHRDHRFPKLAARPSRHLRHRATSCAGSNHRYLPGP